MNARIPQKITAAVVARWLPAMSHKIAIIGMLGASITVASAGDFTTYATNVINPNGVAVTDAGGNMTDYQTFTNSVAQAFAANYGGVWDMEAPSGWTQLANTNVVTFTNSSGNTILALTHQTPGNLYVRQAAGSGSGTAGVPTSGGNVMAGENGALTDPRSFIPSEPLLAVGVIQVNRNDANRVGYLTVVYMDGNTATTSGSPGNAAYFHGLTGTANNPIVKFTVMNGSSSPARWDDVGFIVSTQQIAATITTQPASQSLYESDILGLTVAASGVPSVLTYQWQAGAPFSSIYTNIPGATNATLTIPWVTNSADYVVVVTNSVGSVTSAVANVTVNPATYIYGLFNGDFEIPGVNGVTSGYDMPGKDVSGWFNAGPNQNDSGLEDSGYGHSSSYAAKVQKGQSGAYQITTNVLHAGDLITMTWWERNAWQGLTAKVSLLSAASQRDAYGSTTSLTSQTNVLGNGNTDFNWYQRTLTYTVGAGDEGKLLGVFFGTTDTGTGGWGDFDDFRITISPPTAPPVILTQPASHSAWLASTTTFTVLASGVGLNYQWQALDTNSLIFTNISNGGQFSGANSATLTISNVAVENALDYIVVVSNVGGSVTSSPAATLTVIVDPPYMGVVASKTVNQYDNTTLFPTFVTGATSYQWMAGAVGSGSYTNLVNGGRFSGVNTATLAIANVQPEDGLDYVLVASNVSGSTTNDPAATLTVNPIIYLETFTTTNSSIAGIGWVADAVNGMYGNIDAGANLIAYSSVWTNQAFYTTTKLDTGSTGVAFPIINLTNVSNLAFSVDNQSWWNPANLHTYFAVQVNGGQWFVSTTEIPQAGGGWVTQTQTIDMNAFVWNELTVSGTGGTNGALPLIGGAATNDLTGYITGAGLVVVASESAWTAFDNFKITGDGFTILPGLSIAPAGSDVILTWGYGTLVESTDVTGPWTPVSGAVSPKTVTPTGGSHFYGLQLP